MADYIEKQAAIDRFQNLSYDDWNQGVSTTWANAYAECADMIEDIPSADVVEVVRCKDCKHKYETLGISSTWFSCEIWHDAVEDDDFCSRAERRTDG